MTHKQKTGLAALALCFSALALAPAANAKAEAESILSCSSLLTSVLESPRDQGGVGILKAKPLERWQARPWARIPLGVALWVRAPRGTTAADLHNLAAQCVRTGDPRSPLCVQDASVRVRREGGLYVLQITSDSRALALEIQRRSRPYL